MHMEEFICIDNKTDLNDEGLIENLQTEILDKIDIISENIETPNINKSIKKNDDEKKNNVKKDENVKNDENIDQEFDVISSDTHIAPKDELSYV